KREIPPSLANCTQLNFFLDLSSNDITGPIPIWVMNLTKLNHLDFSLNMLQGSIPISISQPFVFLDISSNRLQGSLPLLSSPIYFYSISKNKLTGKISPMICNMIFLEILNLLENSLSGKIPKCLGNLSDSLVILNLRRNNLYGTFLDTWTNGSKLRTIDWVKTI
ncbi:receptor like protein 27, partial [Quercus suber]